MWLVILIKYFYFLLLLTQLFKTYKMEQRIDFDDEENDFNAINSSVTKRRLRIESDSENEDLCDGSSNIKNNELIESEHSITGVEDVEKDHVNSTEHATEGVEEDVDVSDKEDEYDATKKISDSEDDGHKSMKRLVAVNTDSEDELSTSSPVSGDKKETRKKNVSRRLAITGSDSEDSETTKSVSKKLSPARSDSEDELTLSSSNTNKDECSKDNHTGDESYTNGELIPENNQDVLTTSTFQKSRLSALYDSESSEDETQVSHNEINTPDLPRGKRVSKSRKPKLPAEPKEKKMTAKEALQQRQEITSTSQRMMRESRVSLPYHVPKTRSIKEFLKNRPKFASPLMQNTCRTPPSLAMKMSVQQLQVVVKKLEERNKEIQKFYESESESEEEVSLDESAHNEENVNEDDNNLNALNDINDQNEENAKESVDDLDVAVNHHNEENVNEIDGDVNVINEFNESTNNENEKVTDTELNHGEAMQEMVTNPTEETIANQTEATITHQTEEMETNETEEMFSLVMPDMSSEADTSNLSGLEASTEIIEDVQNKTDLEHDSIQNCDEIQNKSNPTLEDSSTEILETEEIVKKKLLEDSGNSLTYNFNLDDLEESEDMVQPDPEDKLQEPDVSVEVQEKTVEELHFERMLRKYEGESTQITTTQIVEKKLSALELLKQKVGGEIPCLKGAPGEEIDLNDIEGIDGITRLKERFMKHVAKKHITKHKVQLDVVNLSQGEMRKETVAMSVEADKEPVVINEIPGLKLRKLKNELQMQMAQRRSELWEQRRSNVEKVESVEKADYETEAILDDEEEEAELTEEDSTDEEIENDEQLMDVDEESKDKCGFFDDQAEEDDDDAEEDNTELNEVDQEEELNEGQEDELNEDEEDGNSEVNENEEHDVTAIRKPRRLLIGNPENSDSDDEETEPSFKNNVDASLCSTDTAEGDEFPPNLPLPNKNEKTPSKSKSQFSFLTPVQQLTGLQSLNSGSKFLNETSPSTHSIVLAETSPLKENSFRVEDAEDTTNSQASGDEENVQKPATQENCPIGNTAPTTQDLLNICSGGFSIEGETQNNVGLESQPLDNDKHVFVEPVPPTQIHLNTNKEVKNLDEDNLITELLNEEEMEQFRKKFDSPLIPNNTASRGNTKSGRLVIDSSDEENEDTFEPRKKTKKKLDFSDDESDVESEEDQEEEIDLHENISEDELEDEESSNIVVEYDSEENEIEVEVEEKKKTKPGVKSREFFENEAELSESDWDSEDEDEKGLDILETEQGDADVFDENKMRNDLGKIHMRRVLDQDNQEIKMLQELLLEDGELHGTGRQKQFRWRNIDDMDNNEEVRNDADVDVYLDEEESEEQWRKIRYEREMFLKNKQESSTALESDNLTATESDSQILKLGEEALRKSSSKVALEKSKMISRATEVTRVEITKPFAILNTRGSFLTRSDKFLSKLAEINKVNTSVATKNAKKIVFETRSIENGDTVGLANGKKRKCSEGTPSIIKKLRLSSNLSPNIKTVDRKKQLFN